MPVEVFDECPADDLGGLHIFGCRPVLEARSDVDGQPDRGCRGIPARSPSSGRSATLQYNLGTGACDGVADRLPVVGLDIGLQCGVLFIGAAAGAHGGYLLYLR